MPVHEYECDVCGKRFDLRRHFGDPQPNTCPDGHQGIHRVFAPPTIIFKGSGFYVTDNGRNGLDSRKRSKDVETTEPAKDDPKSKAKEGEPA